MNISIVQVRPDETGSSILVCTVVAKDCFDQFGFSEEQVIVKDIRFNAAGVSPFKIVLLKELMVIRV